MQPAPEPMKNNPKLPVGLELMKSDILGLESPWYFVRGEMVWSWREGWKEFYEGNRDDCYFKSPEEAFEAWNKSES